jgi:hypothetical protein
VIGSSELHLSDLVETVGDRIDPLVVSFDDAAGAPSVAAGRGHRLQFPIPVRGASEPAAWADRLLATHRLDPHPAHHAGADGFRRALLDRALLSGSVAWTLDYYPLPFGAAADAETGPVHQPGGRDACAGCEERRRLPACSSPVAGRPPIPPGGASF